MIATDRGWLFDLQAMIIEDSDICILFGRCGYFVFEIGGCDLIEPHLEMSNYGLKRRVFIAPKQGVAHLLPLIPKIASAKFWRVIMDASTY